MKKQFQYSLTYWATILGFLILFSSVSFGAAVNKMTKEELKKIMGSDTTAILDVRQGRDWNSSEFKIKGAIRINSGDLLSQSKKYPKDTTMVLYCA